jgi:phage baseplate assembly protein W
MAIIDTTRKPYLVDNDDKIFVGIDLPFRKSDGISGYFASTTTTIEAVKNNIRNLLNTQQGERLFQPKLGLNLRKFLFEQVTDELIFIIQEEIIDTFKVWLPFVNIDNIEVNFDNKSNGGNSILINVIFNINRNSTSLDSVQVVIGE